MGLDAMPGRGNLPGRTKHWPTSLPMRALLVAFVVGPFLFVSEIGWVRACAPAVVILTSIGLRILGVRNGWLVPWDSNPSFLKPSSRSGINILIIVTGSLFVLILLALFWSAMLRYR